MLVLGLGFSLKVEIFGVVLASMVTCVEFCLLPVYFFGHLLTCRLLIVTF